MTSRRSRAWASIATALAGLLALGPRALAGPPAGPPPSAPQATSAEASAAPSAEEQDVAARKSRAQKYFEQGLVHYQKEAWDAALAEFVRSRALYPTRAATQNAAFCLRKLRRLDEALAMFEEMLLFSNLPERERSIAQDAIAEIEASLGSLRVEGAPTGASIVVDGRYRGTSPLPSALRIAAGTHEVRAFKEGQDAFGGVVEVIAKSEAVARLRPLGAGGRLKLNEQRGRVLDVLIDGTIVGKTPWEGSLSVGEHLVTLRGSVNLDALPECAPGEQGAAGKRAAALGKVELGTQPVSVPIRLHEVTPLTLTAEALDTALRIEPTPGGASVAIDSVVVGRGAWEGRLRVGEHTIEVMSDGFVTDVRRVSLLPHKREVLAIELERDGAAPGGKTARVVGAAVGYGAGAIGLGTFITALLLARGKISDLKAECPNNLCPPTAKGDLDAARSLETISTVGLVLGGAGVAAGTIVVLTTMAGGGARRATSGASGLSIRASAGVGGVEIRGSF